MQIRFDGQTVIVAGAARGIGRAITRAFAADGARVLACDRLPGEIEAGPGITALAVDVTDPASIAAVVAKAEGKVDVLVYVAGGVLGQRPKPVEEVEPEEFAGIVDANLKGCFL
ncbi:MAG: SDR family NAD(P)-dependent oxidoreductase, partial [Alphaproteobacteria bacterium]|nr:SDR family NAD(P)-dependent oxidoreductase [Alphaproteobacteria bacterium]